MSQAGRTGCVGALLAAVSSMLGSAAPRLEAEPPATPAAEQVVVRGARALESALASALGVVGQRPVVIVLDVTENTTRGAAALRLALERLVHVGPTASAWHLARLGEAAGPGVATPDRLGPFVAPFLAKPTAVRSTLEALRATVGGLRLRAAAVVYLADWRFEDEERLEGLIQQLARGGHTLSVVGSEAAFGRAWNDGFPDERARFEAQVAGQESPYQPGVGRDPFGPDDEQAPWHGGDTTHPGRPYRWARPWWKTEFTPSELSGGGTRGLRGDRGPDALEDLRRRLPGLGGAGGGPPPVLGPASTAFRTVPLPSAFGPYGLMRAAAVTGGRYVLWSWNPTGRASVTYDFARCNRFGPDLRARDAVRASLGRDPCASACLEAWHLLLSMDDGLVEQTAPLTRALGPQPLERPKRRPSFGTSWLSKAERDAFVKDAREGLALLGRAAESLDRGLAREDASHARHAADARLFRHVVEVTRFEVGEALAAARAVPDGDFGEHTLVSLQPVTWIEPGRDPERIVTTKAEPFDVQAAERVKAGRGAHLRLLAGTPFGEEVALNPVATFRAQRLALTPTSGELPDSGRSPGESRGRPKPSTTNPAPPGGGSGGSGPSTGK